MSTMQITYYKAKCKEDTVVPSLGKCEKGKIYILDQWNAAYWGAAFDIKGAETWQEEVKMDDKPQAEVEAEIEKKNKAEEARLAALAAPTAEQVEKKQKTREEVVNEMGAGRINDLLASYDLPKLEKKADNVELVLTYEKALATAQELSPEEKEAAFKEFGIVKPESGDFDGSAAIAKAVVMQDLEGKGSGNQRNQKAKDKADRDSKKGGNDKK